MSELFQQSGITKYPFDALILQIVSECTVSARDGRIVRLSAVLEAATLLHALLTRVVHLFFYVTICQLLPLVSTSRNGLGSSPGILHCGSCNRMVC